MTCKGLSVSCSIIGERAAEILRTEHKLETSPAACGL